jgi:transcriptional regulator with XRE-family HTH domain
MSNQLKNIVQNIAPERKRRFEYAEQIGAYLYSVLDRKNMSQKDLAKKMGMKPSQLNRYMNGEANLNLETIARIELALDEQIISIRKSPRKEDTRSFTVQVEQRNLESRDDGFKLYHIQDAGNESGSQPTSKDVPASKTSQSEDSTVNYA